METVLVSGGSGFLGGRCVVEPLRRGYAVRSIPDLLVRGMALFDPGARSVVGQLGKRVEISNAKAKTLGWEPRPVEETIADCGRSLAG